jgi:50S ribosomal subunit-associated GTPase HflX
MLSSPILDMTHDGVCMMSAIVLIYVFDIESHEQKKDLENFKNCLDAIRANSKDAHIFCLIHKMDLIQKEEDRVKVCD